MDLPIIASVLEDQDTRNNSIIKDTININMAINNNNTSNNTTSNNTTSNNTTSNNINESSSSLPSTKRIRTESSKKSTNATLLISIPKKAKAPMRPKAVSSATAPTNSTSIVKSSTTEELVSPESSPVRIAVKELINIGIKRPVSATSHSTLNAASPSPDNEYIKLPSGYVLTLDYKNLKHNDYFNNDIIKRNVRTWFKGERKFTTMEASFDIPNWCTLDRRSFDETGKPTLTQAIKKKKVEKVSIASLTPSISVPISGLSITSSQLISFSPTTQPDVAMQDVKPSVLEQSLKSSQRSTKLIELQESEVNEDDSIEEEIDSQLLTTETNPSASPSPSPVPKIKPNHRAKKSAVSGPTAERPFVCCHPGCTQAFADQSKLRRHNLTHSGERRFECPYPDCGKKFSLDFNMKSHYRTHTGERPFGCEYPGCSKRFSQHSNLKLHMKTHMPNPKFTVV